MRDGPHDRINPSLSKPNKDEADVLTCLLSIGLQSLNLYAPLSCPLPLTTRSTLLRKRYRSSQLMWYTWKQKGGAAPQASRYESKPPPPLPSQQQHYQQYQAPQQQYHPPQQQYQAPQQQYQAPPQHSPHHGAPSYNPNQQRLSPSPYGGHGSVMSPPPQAQGPRPTTHNRPPAQNRLPPSPAPTEEGGDPTLEPLFNAVDKNRETKPTNHRSYPDE